ncbi:PIN domain-containing protein [Iningainema tapete]|uniref:PIN domain-containing protein n=1 Tax=Iningainema tapete BLCC-T55 TaxID=2748662 RepID=A0A8J6XSZ4_9CYAN|nr:PIN domain-containing protein [Iningainema tapete]MBD2778646.1 PIN domain-containing protein [Iningainema tapete BLCC-T55]
MNVDESQKSFIDSNIWLYRFIINPRETDAISKQQIATTITNYQNILISTQVVNEVCANLIRKAGFNNAQIQILLEELEQGCEILPVSLETLQSAVKLRAQYLLSFWDSLIVASAILGDASILYSEDMQDGLIVENTLQIVNPFKANFPPTRKS